jgi:hypothetical protein
VSRRNKRLGAGPVSDLEGGAGVGARGRSTRGVMGAEGVLDDAAAHSVNGRCASLGIDEKVLPAEGAPDL